MLRPASAMPAPRLRGRRKKGKGKAVGVEVDPGSGLDGNEVGPLVMPMEDSQHHGSVPMEVHSQVARMAPGQGAMPEAVGPVAAQLLQVVQVLVLQGLLPNAWVSARRRLGRGKSSMSWEGGSGTTLRIHPR